MKQTVSEVTADEVVVMQEMIMNGQAVSKQEIRFEKKPDKEVAFVAAYVGGHKLIPKVSKGKIKVKGENIDCYIIKYTTEGLKIKSYMSGKIPINGLIKSEIGKKRRHDIKTY